MKDKPQKCFKPKIQGLDQDISEVHVHFTLKFLQDFCYVFWPGDAGLVLLQLLNG